MWIGSKDVVEGWQNYFFKNLNTIVLKTYKIVVAYQKSIPPMFSSHCETLLLHIINDTILIMCAASMLVSLIVNRFIRDNTAITPDNNCKEGAPRKFCIGFDDRSSSTSEERILWAALNFASVVDSH
jgi:hypothetical protein